MKKTAIILVNLGTPDAPTPKSVRRYLKEFLSDTRVIEIPKLIWQVILTGFVLTTRPKRVAHAYASIWMDDGSPLLVILKNQAKDLQDLLSQQGIKTPVYPATTYGNPSIQSVIEDLLADGVSSLIVLPLFPQYSATSTAAAFDKIAKLLLHKRQLPELHFITEYHNHPTYIEALAQSVERYWAVHGRADKLLMSFHGIPKPYADKGDPYPEQCRTTAVLLADRLGLSINEWAMSFQSRFGAQEWLKPYTDELLGEWGAARLSVQVISPAFSADCLETLEELAVENKDNFLQAGGRAYDYIPALNTDELHIQMMAELVKQYI
ncbi:ferrochelatase [Moraxella catarrhalis]|uniref:ferrochelatase n=1 Tax=Moraxella catarrhalis TaxID=480 RepID=UPI000E535FEB|nr:ferrochelatase [Moraxella catarrhalis]AXT92822.1 ferrochelatase [Moraxella catarrhalis]MCG6817637.1 ferrochelatase [Moraxella catarrhalis]MPX88172.1 ferrochelatase [Moraxella catarrhalis]